MALFAIGMEILALLAKIVNRLAIFAYALKMSPALAALSQDGQATRMCAIMRLELCLMRNG